MPSSEMLWVSSLKGRGILLMLVGKEWSNLRIVSMFWLALMPEGRFQAATRGGFLEGKSG